MGKRRGTRPVSLVSKDKSFWKKGTLCPETIYCQKRTLMEDSTSGGADIANGGFCRNAGADGADRSLSHRESEDGSTLFTVSSTNHLGTDAAHNTMSPGLGGGGGGGGGGASSNVGGGEEGIGGFFSSIGESLAMPFKNLSTFGKPHRPFLGVW